MIKEKIIKLFDELKISDLIKNIQVIGNKVVIDAYTESPTMHEKKRMEQAIQNSIKTEIDSTLEVKVNLENKQQEPKNPNQIRGSRISKIKNIIAIASGKGGVGKSTVTSNIAISLQKMGFNVGVLDADIYGPSLPVMFDLQDSRPQTAEVDGVNKMQPLENYGIKVMSIGFFAQSNQAVVWRGPMASKALNQMITDVHWGNLDFLLIDLPPGTGDIHLSIVQQLAITGAVIVSTPQKIALDDVRKGVAMFQLDAINVPVLGLVENMSYFSPAELPNNKYYIFGENGAKNMAENLKIPFLGEIPLVQSVREASDAGRPAALQDDTPIVNTYKEIARNMVEQMAIRNEELPPTEIVRITTMAGCSAVKKNK